MAFYSSHTSKNTLPPLEAIGDLLYSPSSDIPFGKRIRIGVKEETIYESAVENGYRTGIRAHQLFIVDHQQTEPVVLDDKQFTMLIKHLLPSGLKPAEQGLWRSYFIIGWTCVYLGIAADDEEAVADSDI